MGTFHVIPKETKEQILHRIKDEGISVSQAAADHGISTKTIYNWMRGSTIVNHSTLEINKLKRENKELAELIGHLTLNLERTKKKR
jgi:transposase-like protein